MSVKVLNSELTRALRSARATPPRSFGQWCREELIIPEGTYKGHPFRVETQPAARLWCEAIDSGYFSEFVFTAPSQFGKTLIGFVAPVLYHTCELVENFVLGVPFGEMFANKWEAELEPAMIASPVLRSLLPRRGAGAKGGKVKDSITLSNGTIIKAMSAGGDDATKAGFTARALSVTELAKFSASGQSSVEADPFRQLRARQRAYKTHQRRTYAEGTVTTEKELPWSLRATAPAYDEDDPPPISTESVIVSPCPHCENFVDPNRDHLCGWEEARTDREAHDLAFWCCPACGQLLTENERRMMVRDSVLLHRGQKIDKKGRITGTVPNVFRLWFRATPFVNLFLGPGDIATDEWRAAQIPEDDSERINADKELHQFIWCLPYSPPKIGTDLEIDKKSIQARRLQIPAGTTPADTEILTAGIDIGAKQIWYLFRAERDTPDGRCSHVPLYGVIDVPSDQMKVHDAIVVALRDLFEQVLSLGLTVEGSGQPRGIDGAWFDSNFESDAVKTFVEEVGSVALSSPYQCAIGRGQSQMDGTNFHAPRKTGNIVREVDPSENWYVERLVDYKCNLVIWNADIGKWHAQQRMTLPVGSPGSITLHAGTLKIHERLARHWTNEKLVTETHALKGEWQRWKRTGDNHLLDCYCMAAMCADRIRTRREKTPAVWNYSD